MARPQRCRRICCKPKTTEFLPHDITNAETVTLALDEFEVIRLVDLEKQTHKECAAMMGISRTTVTEMYENARYKIADSIVNGCRLLIEGGNYILCDGSSLSCPHSYCHRQHTISRTNNGILKGEAIMRIAVTYENGEIFQHFGHTEQFKFYDIENGAVVSSQTTDTNGSGHGDRKSVV